MNRAITLEIRNNFHNVSINLRVKGHYHRLTPSQLRKIYSLCGFKDCQCMPPQATTLGFVAVVLQGCGGGWRLENRGWDSQDAPIWALIYIRGAK